MNEWILIHEIKKVVLLKVAYLAVRTYMDVSWSPQERHVTGDSKLNRIGYKIEHNGQSLVHKEK